MARMRWDFVIFFIALLLNDALSNIKKEYFCKDPDTGILHAANTTWPATSFCGNYTCKLKKKIRPTILEADEISVTGSQHDNPPNDDNFSPENSSKTDDDTTTTELIDQNVVKPESIDIDTDSSYDDIKVDIKGTKTVNDVTEKIEKTKLDTYDESQNSADRDDKETTSSTQVSTDGTIQNNTQDTDQKEYPEPNSEAPSNESKTADQSKQNAEVEDANVDKNVTAASEEIDDKTAQTLETLSEVNKTYGDTEKSQHKIEPLYPQQYVDMETVATVTQNKIIVDTTTEKKIVSKIKDFERIKQAIQGLGKARKENIKTESQDEYLSDDVIKAFCGLLYVIKKNDLAAILELYNRAQELNVENTTPKASKSCLTDEFIRKLKSEIKLQKGMFQKENSYWYDPVTHLAGSYNRGGVSMSEGAPVKESKTEGTLNVAYAVPNTYIIPNQLKNLENNPNHYSQPIPDDPLYAQNEHVESYAKPYVPSDTYVVPESLAYTDPPPIINVYPKTDAEDNTYDRINSIATPYGLSQDSNAKPEILQNPYGKTEIITNSFYPDQISYKYNSYGKPEILVNPYVRMQTSNEMSHFGSHAVAIPYGKPDKTNMVNSKTKIAEVPFSNIRAPPELYPVYLQPQQKVNQPYSFEIKSHLVDPTLSTPQIKSSSNQSPVSHINLGPNYGKPHPIAHLGGPYSFQGKLPYYSPLLTPQSYLNYLQSQYRKSYGEVQPIKQTNHPNNQIVQQYSQMQARPKTNKDIPNQHPRTTTQRASTEQKDKVPPKHPYLLSFPFSNVRYNTTYPSYWSDYPIQFLTNQNVSQENQNDAVLVNPALSDKPDDDENLVRQRKETDNRQQLLTDEETLAPWQTVALTRNALEDVKANMDRRISDHLLRPLMGAKKRLERVAKVLKLDELKRCKRKERSEHPLRISRSTNEAEVYIEKTTCQYDTELGFFRIGNMSASYPHCCPQKLEVTTMPPLQATLIMTETQSSRAQPLSDYY